MSVRDALKAGWAKVKAFFKDSETIFFARAQVALGALGVALTSVLADPTVNAAVQAAMQPKYVPFYLIGLGVLTELLRRRRATDL